MSDSREVHDPEYEAYKEASVRHAAARARVSADKRRGIKTPNPIVELATAEPVEPTPRWVRERLEAGQPITPLPLIGEGDLKEASVIVAAARARVSAERKLNKETPQWVKDLAEYKL